MAPSVLALVVGIQRISGLLRLMGAMAGSHLFSAANAPETIVSRSSDKRNASRGRPD
jgi:hypothetical protein